MVLQLVLLLVLLLQLLLLVLLLLQVSTCYGLQQLQRRVLVPRDTPLLP